MGLRNDRSGRGTLAFRLKTVGSPKLHRDGTIWEAMPHIPSTALLDVNDLV